MVLKKINAALSLLAFAGMAAHIGYSSFVCLTFYYDPQLKLIMAIPFMTAVCLHAVLGMCSVFLLSDGTRAADYKRLNIGTVIQRVTAALILPLLILHINSFGLLQSTAEQGQYVLFALLILAQVIFYAVVTAHAAVSFGRALITLGRLSSERGRKAINTAVYIFCALLFAAASFAVIKGELAMFLHI